VHNAGFLAGGKLEPRTAQGFEPSLGVMHLAHHLLTRELWGLLQARSPGGRFERARVISHASAAFITGDLSSLLVGDGAADVRGEAMVGCLGRTSSVGELVSGTVRSLAKLYLRVPLPPGEAALCPLAGVYSRAKLAQVLFSQELQHRASRHRANAKSTDEHQEAGEGAAPRAVATFSLHPGTVRSGIVTLPAWLVRPTAIGARVLLYCLLTEGAAPGSFVDEMQSPHDLLLATARRADNPQADRKLGLGLSRKLGLGLGSGSGFGLLRIGVAASGVSRAIGQPCRSKALAQALALAPTQVGRPRGYAYSVPIAAYLAATQACPLSQHSC
jgi:NAD(P)-dependent dehydrogenase (short-subunit alcohol dehydrogenase family)